MSTLKGDSNAVTRREHRLDTEAKRVQLVDAFGGVVTDGNLAEIIDTETTADTIYLGYAQIGTATSAAEWQIAKITIGSTIPTTWADGDDLFNNVWDNRASLSYS